MDPPVIAQRVAQANRLPFSILCDEDRAATKAFGVLHERGGPMGEDIALPAHFLIDQAGRIVWEFVATSVTSRVDPAEVSQQIERLLAQP